MMVSTLPPPPPFRFSFLPRSGTSRGRNLRKKSSLLKRGGRRPKHPFPAKIPERKKKSERQVYEVKKEGYKNLLDNSHNFFWSGESEFNLLLFPFFLCWRREKQRQSAKRNANQVSGKSRNRLDKPVFLLQVHRGNFLFFLGKKMWEFQLSIFGAAWSAFFGQSGVSGRWEKMGIKWAVIVMTLGVRRDGGESVFQSAFFSH